MCQESFRVERYFSGFDAGVRGSYPMYMFGVVNPLKGFVLRPRRIHARKCLTMTHIICDTIPIVTKR